MSSGYPFQGPDLPRLTPDAAGRVGQASRATVRQLVAEERTPAERADALTAERLAAHLHTRGSSDPELIIRTSSEVRLTGFPPWQSAPSEVDFCEAYRPSQPSSARLRDLESDSWLTFGADSPILASK